MKGFEIFKEIVKGTLVGIYFVVLPVLAFAMITSKFSLFGIKSYTILTGSMEPTIETGSVLFTLESPTYKTGDIIAFKSGNVTITHRIVNAQDSTGKVASNLVGPLSAYAAMDSASKFQTKGDANSSVDSNLVSKDQVIGKALFHIPYIGRLSMDLKTPKGFLIMVVLPTVIFVLIELWGIKKEIERSIERKLRRQLESQRNAPSNFWGNPV